MSTPLATLKDLLFTDNEVYGAVKLCYHEAIITAAKAHRELLEEKMAKTLAAQGLYDPTSTNAGVKVDLKTLSDMHELAGQLHFIDTFFDLQEEERA